MKQFARCTNCRQWYVYHAVAAVEIVRGSGRLSTTLWCQGCIRETERRSPLPDETAAVSERAHAAVSLHVSDAPLEPVPPGDFQQLVDEHLKLMERALHEDDTTIILLVEDFMERCETHQAQGVTPEQAARLTSHVQYWSTFVTAMKQGG